MALLMPVWLLRTDTRRRKSRKHLNCGGGKPDTCYLHSMHRDSLGKYGQQYVDKGASTTSKKPPTTNRVPQKEGSATRPPGHTNPGLNLSTKKSLRSRWKLFQNSHLALLSH